MSEDPELEDITDAELAQQAAAEAASSNTRTSAAAFPTSASGLPATNLQITTPALKSTTPPLSASQRCTSLPAADLSINTPTPAPETHAPYGDSPVTSSPATDGPATMLGQSLQAALVRLTVTVMLNSNTCWKQCVLAPASITASEVWSQVASHLKHHQALWPG